MEKLENYSRRNNIKIVGLKEGIEGKDPIDFFRIGSLSFWGWDRKIRYLKLTELTEHSNPSHDKMKTTINLIRFLRYQDRESTLKAAIQRAKNGDPLMIEGRRVFFYPDISSDL